MLPKMRHAERLKEQGVAVVGDRHRLVETSVGHPVGGEVETMRAEVAAEPDAAECALLIVYDHPCLEPVGVDASKVDPLPEIA